MENMKATFESVCIILREIAEIQMATEMQMAASGAAYERRMKNLEDRYGSLSNNFGHFAEKYFFNSFENGKQDFFGEKFDIS